MRTRENNLLYMSADHWRQEANKSEAFATDLERLGTMTENFSEDACKCYVDRAKLARINAKAFREHALLIERTQEAIGNGHAKALLRA